jgi:membrane-associated phospholipid phosphatase
MRATYLPHTASVFVLAFVTSQANAQQAVQARAQDEEPPTTPVALHHDVAVDLVATGVLAGGLVTWTAVRPSALRSSCVICDGARGGEVNGVDDFFRTALRRRDGAAADVAGDVVTYGVGPAMGLALTIGAAAADRRADEAPLNALLVAEASLAAIAANEAFGALLRRPRPDASAGDDSVPSFPAGSAASIMAITASSATIASLRGYRLAPLVWIVGTTVGLTATYLRIAADKSYFTDNLAGAAIGMSVGALVPLLFHRRVEASGMAANSRWFETATIATSTVPGGRTLSLGWAL